MNTLCRYLQCFLRQPWLCAAWLFLASSFSVMAAAVDLEKAAQDPQWLLLVHDYNGSAQIRDSSFLLSAADYSPLRELTATLDLFRLSPAAAFCRFPARLMWAQQRGLISLVPEHTQPCAKLDQYLQSVPFQSLDLVFATEVLSSTTSMMGHVFLKAEGMDNQGFIQASTLAYFTRIRTLNPLVLMYENTLGGMEGYFVVRNFQVDAKFYRDKEQRTIWQYRLAADDFQLQLLQYHIFELKDAKIDYYFQAFNCATLTLEIIALLNPDLMDERDWIVTPIDVVKAAKRYQLVIEEQVNAADSLALSQLRQVLPAVELEILDAWISGQQPVDVNASVLLDAKAEQYTRIRSNDLVGRQLMTRTEQADLLQHWASDPQSRLTPQQLREPTAAAQDSLWSVGYTQQPFVPQSAASLRWLANGHLLMGDNNAYQAESELMMGNIVLQYQQPTLGSQQRWQLAEFTLYQVRSLAPTSTEFPTYAGEFYLGYHPVLTAQGWQSQTELSAGIGKSVSLGPRVIAYSLLGAGAVTDFVDGNAFLSFKAGLLWSVAGRHKVAMELESNSGKLKDSASSQQAHLQWRWQLSEQWMLVSQLQYSQLATQQDQAVGLQLVRYY